MADLKNKEREDFILPALYFRVATPNPAFLDECWVSWEEET